MFWALAEREGPALEGGGLRSRPRSGLSGVMETDRLPPSRGGSWVVVLILSEEMRLAAIVSSWATRSGASGSKQRKRLLRQRMWNRLTMIRAAGGLLHVLARRRRPRDGGIRNNRSGSVIGHR